jgi:PhnB protein
MTLGATLYISNSTEAVTFYQEAFGLTLGYNEKNPDGSYLHAALYKDGTEIFAVSESCNKEFVETMLNTSWPTMSYGINFDSEEEIRKAYAFLADGGHVLRPLGPLPWSPCSADVVDKYGIYWYICIIASLD